MKQMNLCTLKNVSLEQNRKKTLHDIQLNISEGQRIALISEAADASLLLQLIAGMHREVEGNVCYKSFSKGESIERHWIQYVPDDIVCYTDMAVWQFLKGVAWVASDSAAAEAEAVRLCELYGITLSEQLLDMTFEQNRLVAMIQALMLSPRLLLLDQPYDMLGRSAYLTLMEELYRRNRKGMALVVAAHHHEDVVIPCDEYLYFRDGTIAARYLHEELPQPAKVVTLWGGTVAPLEPSKLTMLYQSEERMSFLYREADAKGLAMRLSQTGCWNFTIQDVSMEEQIFGDYERWKS